MELQEIKSFLKFKPGYCKEGAKRLKKVLQKKGFEPTIKDCEIALKEVKQEIKSFSNRVLNNTAKILIYDIETSPNIGWFWRTGYNQTVNTNQILKERSIICVSYKWLNEDVVYNLTWDINQNDYFLIEQFINVLNEADLIVAHNGDNFDLKWLRTRALYHGLHKQMLPNYKQFDTLKVAKSKLYLNSNKLDYISKFLGFEGKILTTPDLWNEVVIKNNQNSLKSMLEYCDEDVRQLEKVYEELQYLDNPKIHVGVLNNNVKYSSPINGEFNLELIKTVTTQNGTIKRIMKDLNNGRLFEMSNTNYLKYNLNK